MKTENFDEAFRRKVESFHPPFRDDEIDRIQGYVNKHIPMSFWQRFGHTFTYSLGTVIIVSLLTTIIYQANENKNLLNKVADLSNKLEQKQAIVALENAPKRVIIDKTDTVYVLKHIRKEIPNVEEVSPDNQLSTIIESSPSVISKENNIGNLNSNDNTQDDKNEDLDLTNSSKLNEVPTSNKQEKTILASTRKSVISPTKAGEVRQVSNLSNDKIAKENLVGSQPNATKAIEKKDVKQDSKLSKPIQSNALANDNSSNQTGQIGNLSYNTSQENNDKTLTINDLKRKVFSPIDLKFAFDLSSRKLHSPHFVASPKTRKSFKFPSISMPNLKYRIGLGANADFGQLGTSILTDILFAKRWSVTTGVNMSFLGFEHFGDEDDFKRRTDKDFRDAHDVVLPLSNSIENIDAHQVLFRLPIYLNYRLPLRNDYTILFSTGTDLDFHLNQITSFSHHDLVRTETQEGIQEKIPVPLFNNWMISTGIEKRWKHFSVQLSPYLSYQIKQVSYRKEDFIFGFKANGFYRLSR